MPVQIPMLKRMAPSEQTSVGRINVDVPDSTRAVGQVQNQLEQLGGKAIDVMNEMEDQSIALEATKAASDYEVKYKTQLARLKEIKGDPTESYSNLEKQSVDWQNEIMKNYEGSSSRMQDKIKAQLEKTYYGIRDHAAVQEASQHAIYDNEVTKGAVALSSENAINALGLVDFGKDKKTPEEKQAAFNATVPAFQLHLNDIENKLIEKGRRDGRVYTNKDGKSEYSDSLKMEIREAKSDVIKQAVLITNGVDPEGGKLLLEKYSNDLVASAKEKLFKHGEDSALDLQAIAEVDKLKFLDPVVADKKAERLEGKFGEKVRAKLNTLRIQREGSLKSAQKAVFEDLTQVVRGKDFFTIDQLMSDPIIKSAVDNDRISSKQISALQDLVSNRKESDPKAFMNMISHVENGTLKGLSEGDILEAMNGLSKADKATFKGLALKAKNATQAEEMRSYANMAAQLKRGMLELDKSEGGIRMQGSTLRGENLKQFNKSYSLMVQQAEASGIITGTKAEQDKWVTDHLTDLAKQRAFAPVKKDPIVVPKSSGKAKLEEAAAAPTKDEKMQMLSKFRKEKGRPYDPKVDSKEDLLKYRDSK